MAYSFSSILKENPRFSIIFTAGAISQIGDWFNTIAIFTLLHRLIPDSASVLSWVIVIKQIPLVFLAPLAGTCADRFERRRIMIVTDILRAALVAALLIPAVTNSVAAVFIVITLQACTAAFFEPARAASIPQVVTSHDLPLANALSSISWSASLVVGSMLGGFATELFGWQGAIAIDALSFIVSALILLWLPRLIPEARELADTSADSYRSFLGALARDPSLRAFSSAKFGFGIGGGMYLLLTVFGQQIYQFGSTGALGISILYLARGCGALVAPFVTRVLQADSREQSITTVSYTFLVAGVCYASFSVVDHWLPAAIFVFFAHGAGGLLWLHSTLLLQRAAPPAFRGRIFGLELGLFTLTSSISAIVYGYAIDAGLLTPRQAALVLAVSWMIPYAAWKALTVRLSRE